MRYLVSSPSSYVYFDNTLPSANGGFVPFDAAQCASFDDWKYGMCKRPPYVNDRSPEQLEAAYASRRVTYLVGGNDDAPNQPALDRSCPAESVSSVLFILKRPRRGIVSCMSVSVSTALPILSVQYCR